MKKSSYSIVTLMVGFLVALSGFQQSASAQVPSGVVVDSIGPVTAAASWRTEAPFRSHHLVADPATGQMVFIAGQSANMSVGESTDPAWYYSTDNGTTWSINTSPFSNNATAGAVVVAADSNFTVYVVYNRGDSLFFNEDAFAHDGSTLGSEVMVNAPGTDAQCADIAVSKSGKYIIITAQPTHGDYDSLYAYVSSDSGQTWTQHLALTTTDPSIAPRAFSGHPTFQWDITSLSMGTNGYAFVAVHADYDSTFPNDHWNLISETSDYGATWTPSWVTPPPSSEYQPTGNAWDYNGAVLAVGNTPHLVSEMINSSGVQVLVESHRENGVWVHHAVSRPDTMRSYSYELPRDGGLGMDTQGRLYCVFTNENLSVANTTYEVYISGSSDGGDTWTQPIRLTDTQPFCSGNDVVNSPTIPQLMGSTSAAIAINGEMFGLFPGQNPPTGWVESQFPLSAVWNGPFDQDTTLRVLQADGYHKTFGTAGFNWVDITQIGTRIDSLLHDVPSGSYDPDDGNAGMFPIGFHFGFYGTSYDSFEVSANGYISFTDSTFGWPPPFPINNYKTIIAPFASDAVNPDDIHNPLLYYYDNPAKDTCVIEWYKESSWYSASTTDSSITYEIILAKEDSSITFQYDGIGPTPQYMNVQVKGGTSAGFDFNKLGFVPAVGEMVKVQPLATPVESRPVTASSFVLNQNYPNPFNPTTQIDYSISRNSFVTLKVYNVLGQEVATLFSGVETPGNHSVTFDASRFASGVYFYRLKAGNFTSVKKMILMK